jgi:hypothetical protein
MSDRRCFCARIWKKSERHYPDVAKSIDFRDNQVVGVKCSFRRVCQSRRLVRPPTYFKQGIERSLLC